MAKNLYSKEHILSLVEKVDTGCWIWKGATDKLGYGRLKIVGLGKWSAYRTAYELFVGPIPDGLVLDHLCRVPSCVNPEHLEPITQRENQLRGVGFSAVNSRKTHCDNGHEFTPENTYIRKMGRRSCRACNLAAAKRYYERKKCA